MFKQLRLMTLLLGCSSLVCAQPAARPSLEIAIFPYLSTRALLSIYQPLQQYLEQKLQRQVRLVTAPDMRTFVERTQEGRYAYVVTAPHFARLAQVEAGYRPLLRAVRNLQGVLLAQKNGGVRNLEDLRGKVVATPDRLAIISILGLELLKKHGLTPGKDVTIESLPTHNAAVVSLQNGAVDAAVVSLTAFLQMSEAQREGLLVVRQTPEVPHVMYLASAKVSAADAAAFAEVLLQFIERTVEGRQFIEGLGYQGLRAPSESELRSLDTYMETLKASLVNPR